MVIHLDWLVVLILSHFVIKGCHFKRHPDVVPYALFDRVNYAVDMHLHLRLLNYGLAFHQSRLVLSFRNYALVFDEVSKSDDHFDTQDEGEKNQKAKSDEEFDDEETIEENQS